MKDFGLKPGVFQLGISYLYTMIFKTIIVLSAMKIANNFYTQKHKTKGFTLVELLIVITIIAIISGLLFAIIDPEAQQNRARNGVIITTLSKYGFAINSYYSARGTLPTGTQLVTELDNVTYDVANCSSTELNCSLKSTGMRLRVACTNNNPETFTGTGGSECYIKARNRWDGSYDKDSGVFRVWAVKYVQTPPNMSYVLDSKEGLFECPQSVGNPSYWATGLGGPALTPTELTTLCTPIQ